MHRCGCACKVVLHGELYISGQHYSKSGPGNRSRIFGRAFLALFIPENNKRDGHTDIDKNCTPTKILTLAQLLAKPFLKPKIHQRGVFVIWVRFLSLVTYMTMT